MQIAPQDILKKYWGYPNFKSQQEAIITAVLEGKDTIALLPTGGGKSICYQIPALALDGITVVVSPLIALMKDQVSQLKKRDIKALAIPSGVPYSELDTLLDNCIYGNYKLLYLSPERLQQPLVIERLKQMQVSLIAVDEAHCISQWGHDFRPAYLEVNRLREIHPDAPLIAVTATATETVLQDIKQHLVATEATVFTSSYLRKNLIYTIKESTDKYFDLLQAINTTPSSVIIYTRSRKGTVQLADYLNARGITTAIYHGGLSKKDRTKYFEQWVANTHRVMVATSAFGMGIDKGDVSLVIHFDLPDSIENYFQEAGRAGRDGKPATALLLHNETDSVRLKNQFLKNIPDVAFVKNIYKRLCNYFTIAYGEGNDEIHNLNFSDFCQAYSLKGIPTYNVLTILDRNGIIQLDKTFSQKASVSFNVSDVMLTYYLIKNNKLDTIVKAVLRTYGGIFNQVTTINYGMLADKANTNIAEIHRTFLLLEQDDIITYNYKSYDTAITFLVPREDDRTINSIAKHIKEQAVSKTKQIGNVLTFLKQKEECRTQWLLRYFGESLPITCNACDCCNTNNVQPVDISAQIVAVLKEGAKSSKELAFALKNDTGLLKALKLLLDQKKITITANNKYTLQ